MIKLIFFAARLPHLTPGEFDAYWRDHHAPLVASHARTLRIRRYVQTAPLGDAARDEAIRAPRGGGAFAYDGLGELWWDSFADMDANRRTPQALAALAEILADERRFIDFSRSQIWFGTERTILPG